MRKLASVPVTYRRQEEAFKTAASQERGRGEGKPAKTWLSGGPHLPTLPPSQHILIGHLLCARHGSRCWEHKVGQTDELPLLWSFAS